MTQEFWDGLYGEREQVWSGRPNAQLVDLVSDLPPGTALDIGCGEGGDAIWLAERGWSVTGIDISTVALDRARRAAADCDLDVWFEQVDLAQGFPAGRYDLVSACFLQSPVELDRPRVLRTARSAVAPGGHLVVVDHAAPPPGADHPPAMFPAVGDTLAALELGPGWTVVVAEERQRTAVRHGETHELLDGVLLLRREPPPA